MPATQPAFLSRLAALLCAAAIGAFITGCVPSQSGSGGPASSDRADRLLRRGDNAAAAQMYEQLAERNPPPDRNDYAFASARAWLAANRADDAQRALELAVPEGMAAQQLERELLRTEVAVARGQYTAAWQRISQVQEPREAAQAARLYQLRERVALRSGQPVEAVRAGSARERVATDDAGRTQARRDLLADLRSAIEGGLRIDPASSSDPLVRGWFEVAQIAVAAGRSPLSAQAAITRWRSRFPGHPASTIAESDILRPAERPLDGGAGIANTGPLAMLLPLTGRYATEAGLIRDGFQAALARLPADERPQLRVYDTGTLTVASALQNALAEGAGFIVGPLTPEEVQTAYEQRPANLPMLMLNTLPGGGYVGNQLYQFGLATEDEARQIARQITGSGKRNALVLAPVGDWGTRVAGAFTDELTRDGGSVVAQASYDESTRDLTATLTAVLGIDAARARKQRVQSVVGATLLFEPHPRPDIEAIFVAGYQNIALRQINPQLRFFNAGGVPIYTTQQGIGDVAGNRDLEGMWVLDTPWALDTVGPVADLRTATESAWSARGVRQSRFFALGYDSATVALALRRGVAAWPLAGLTGRLNLTPEGRIERSLNWGRLKEGLVQPFDPVAQR